MHAEYDATALVLMRAIKTGVDLKGIINPEILLPLLSHEEIPASATIDL